MALPEVLSPEADFGLPKENYSPVRNARTDFDFADYERLTVAVSMLSYTAPRAWCVVSAGASAASGMVKDHRALWGEASSVVPTVSNTAIGTYRVTWPASVQDLNPTASSVTTTATQFYTAMVSLHEAGQTHCVVSAANIVTVYTATTAGTAAAKDFTVLGY